MDGELHDVGRLLGDVRAVRALARRLVVDASTADDLAQDALWIGVSRAPGAGDAHPESVRRAWFARVLANLARRRGREASSRAARERAVARREAVEDDVVARVDASRRLVELVLALEEPYRSTLLLRFFDDLSPQEIARRTGTNASTVRTRLERGLARLRERIGHRDRSSWLAALAPAGAEPGGVLVVLGKGIWMSTAWKLGLAAAGALVVALVLTRDRSADAPPSRPAAALASSMPEVRVDPPDKPLAAPESSARTVVSERERPASEERAPAPRPAEIVVEPGYLQGIVLRGGEPVAGGTLWTWRGHWRPIPTDPLASGEALDLPLDEGGLARVPIGSDGRFRVGPLTPDWYSLGVDVGTGISLQTYVQVDAVEPGREVVLVLGTACIAGRVHDADALPIEGASVRVSRAEASGAPPAEHHARTDAFGRYAIADLVPAAYWISYDPVGRAGIAAAIDGMRHLAPLRAGETRVVHFGPDAPVPTWTGRVLAADGAPVPLGGRLGFTDPSGAYSEVPIAAGGRFRLRLAPGEHALQATLTTLSTGGGTEYLPLGRHVAPDADQELDLVVPGAVVRARVLGERPAGRAIPLHLAGPDRRPVHAAEVGADGVARFLAVPPGRWRVVATPPHSVEGQAVVEVAPGEAVAELDVVLRGS